MWVTSLAGGAACYENFRLQEKVIMGWRASWRLAHVHSVTEKALASLLCEKTAIKMRLLWMKACLGNRIGITGAVAKICIKIPTWQSGTNKEGVTVHYSITGWARMKARGQSGMPLRQTDGNELNKKCKQKLEARQPHSPVSPHILLSALDTLSRGKGYFSPLFYVRQPRMK